jgi:23S rRNA pseudouridine2605 synthase
VLVRLQKIIAEAGVASRRKAENLIRSGRVRVNGRAVTELGTKADPDKDQVEVDGLKIGPAQPRIAILLNKPDGFITTLHDPEGRPTVASLVSRIPVRLYPVGRLDFHTEGLLILTNDGDLAQKIEHPTHRIEKLYVAKVKGVPGEAGLKKIRNGIVMEGRRTLPARIRVLETKINAWLEIGIREGRQNQIRRMLETIGHPVIKLKRIAIGPLRDDRLRAGEYRFLKPSEIRILLDAAGNSKRATKS